jgi:hypothetical protein
MNRTVICQRLAYAASLFSFLGLIAVAPAEASTTYGGRAYAASVSTAFSSPFYVADTGELPASGGSLGASLARTPANAVLSAQVPAAVTFGMNGGVYAAASLADVSVMLPGSGIQVWTEFVRAACRVNNDEAVAWTEVAGLYVGGLYVPVTGAPNQTVSIPGVVTLIINEQKITLAGDFRAVSVNALHLIVPGVADLVLCHANCSATGFTLVTQPPPPGSCPDLIAGSGSILLGASKADFSLDVGCTDISAAASGQLRYVDSANHLEVASTSISAYTQNGLRRRHIEGSCTINGQAGFTFSADAADNGQPGIGADTFAITLSNGYSATGTLMNGDIVLNAP